MRLIAPVLLCLALVACKPATTAKERTAIQTVLAETDAAKTNAAHGYRNRPVDGKKYLVSLHGISTADCPEKFRLAFLDYVQTWERATGPGSADALVALAERHADTAKAISDSRDTNEARRRLDMAALEYGVGN